MQHQRSSLEEPCEGSKVAHCIYAQIVDTYDPIEDPIDDPIDDPIEDPIDGSIDKPIDDPINDPTDDPIDDLMDDPLDGLCRAVPIRMALGVQARGPAICTNKSVNQQPSAGATEHTVKRISLSTIGFRRPAGRPAIPRPAGRRIVRRPAAEAVGRDSP